MRPIERLYEPPDAHATHPTNQPLVSTLGPAAQRTARRTGRRAHMDWTSLTGSRVLKDWPEPGISRPAQERPLLGGATVRSPLRGREAGEPDNTPVALQAIGLVPAAQALRTLGKARSVRRSKNAD